MAHDIRWIEYILKQHNCVILLRTHHYKEYSRQELARLENVWGFKIAGSINDFSLIHLKGTMETYRKISAIIKKHEIDIFHIMYAEPNALWAIFKNKWKLPVIITTRGTDVLKGIPQFFSSKNYWQRIISRLYVTAIQKADAVTCTSQSQKQSVVELAKFPGNNVKIIRTGVEFNKVINFSGTDLPSELKGQKYILFPRSMRPLYNHEFSLRAIAKLSPEIKSQYKFVFVDRDSWEEAYVKKIEHQMLEMKDCNFTFLPRQTDDQMFTLYKYTSIVVMNPTSDGTPVSAIEAIAFKKPVIIGPLAYDEDLFGNYQLKLISWNETELADKIEGLLTGRIKPDVDALYEKFYEKTDRENQMNLLMDVYNQVKDIKAYN